MSSFTDSAQSKQIDQQEHNVDAHAKRVLLRAQDSVTGNWVNIGASDNGDGTFSIKTDVTPNTPFNVFDEEATVVGSTETTILTYTVPASTTANIQGILVTAGIASRWKLKIGGVTETIIKTSASKPTEQIQFGWGIITATTGQVVTITGYHGDSGTNEMAVNLFGYLT